MEPATSSPLATEVVGSRWIKGEFCPGTRIQTSGSKHNPFSNPCDHLMWVAGHLVVHRGAVLKSLGAEWETSWSSLFTRGAKLAARDQYPAVDEIRSAWDEVSAKLVGSFTEATADLLAKPAPKGPPSFDGKISGLVAFLAFHETYHVGQVSYLRKWLGYGQSVG